MLNYNDGLQAHLWSILVIIIRLDTCSFRVDCYYYVLWVVKYQGVSKCNLLRDRCRLLADPCLDIPPICYLIVDYWKNKKISLCLLCNLANIMGKNWILTKTVSGLSISPPNTVNFSRYNICMSNKVCMQLWEIWNSGRDDIDKRVHLHDNWCSMPIKVQSLPFQQLWPHCIRQVGLISQQPCLGTTKLQIPRVQPSHVLINHAFITWLFSHFYTVI